MTLLDLAKRCLTLIDDGLDGDRFNPPWAYDQKAVPEYIKVEATHAEILSLRKEMRAYQGESAIAYTSGTLNLDGYCHGGRSVNAMNQLRTLIKKLEA